jgi:hypothetical protein
MGAQNIKPESSDFYSYYRHIDENKKKGLYEKTPWFAVFMVYGVRNGYALMPTSIPV